MVGSEGTTKSQAGKAAGKDTDVPFFFFFAEKSGKKQQSRGGSI